MLLPPAIRPSEVLRPSNPTSPVGVQPWAVNDRTEKRDLYERLGVREYFCYDDETQVMVAYRLVGTRYQEIAPETGGGWFSQELGLKLVLWQGEFVNVRRTWLRWATPDGELIPIPEEAADAAELRAVMAETRAVTAGTRAVTAEAQIAEERDCAAAAEQQATAERSRVAEAAVAATAAAGTRAASAEAETRRLQDLLRTLGYTTRPD